MSSNPKTYKAAATYGSDSPGRPEFRTMEFVMVDFPDATPFRRTMRSLKGARAFVKILRRRGYKPSKISGGLDRAFAILGGR